MFECACLSLPRWRGAAPIQRAILAGDAESGVTIMQMDEGLDTGDMLNRAPVPITSDTTSETLHDDLSRLGARLIVETLAGISGASLLPVPQPEAGVTYAPKLAREEGKIDWHRVQQKSTVRSGRSHPGLVPGLNTAEIALKFYLLPRRATWRAGFFWRCGCRVG